MCADAVFLTTQLCCSEGVRLWYQSNQVWNVSKTLVKGEEEYSSISPKAVSNPPLESQGQPAERQKTPKKKSGSSEGTSSGTTSSNALPLEYSPIRHRSAIERVLSALQGTDPILDSAPKVWTTFAVAKNLEITHSPLEDYIIRWLRAYPNSYFLEVLPEVSHQIADGLHNYDLARDSFAILVGEEALDSLRHIREPCVYKRTSFGRKKETLPEQIHTRIEYASKSFLERINRDFTNFVDSMDWIDELPEVRQLSLHTLPKLQDTIHKLRDLLKDYVRGAIYRVLCTHYDTVPGPERQNHGGLDLLPKVERAAIWANIPLSERILTRTYWDALKSFSLFYGESNVDFTVNWNASSSRSRPTHTEKCELERGTYRVVLESDLKALIRNGQNHLKAQTTLHHAQQEPSANALSTWSSTLPDRTNNGTQSHAQLGDLLLAHSSDHKLGHAQAESGVERLPVRSYALSDRTSYGASDVATKNEASIAKPAQPINIVKPLKRTQDFPDALSPPDEQLGSSEQFNFNVRTKWPFGAAREDPVAQVQKSVDGLHFSAISTTDKALKESAGQKSRTEGIPIMSDPWRGYSDQLRKTDKPLRRLAAKADSEHGRPSTSRKTPFGSYRDGTSARPLENLDLAESDIWAEHEKHYEDDGVQEHSNESMSTGYTFASIFFSLEAFFKQAQKYIENFATNKLRTPNHLELGIVNTLVCLEDTEWKYLPLYAGGNDDESMGVFNDDLPTAEHGFTTAGPEIHDGSTPATSVRSPSEFEFVSAGDSASTINASTATNRGFSDTIRRGHVHAVDSADGSMSDSCTMVTPSVDSDDEETFARKQIEAQERIEQAEEAANEERRMAKGKGKMVDEDESYADLFDGEEEEEEEEEEDGNDTDRAEVDDEDDEDEEDMVMV